MQKCTIAGGGPGDAYTVKWSLIRKAGLFFFFFLLTAVLFTLRYASKIFQAMD